MEKDFDFNQIGKRMPYTVPDGFFDTLEARVSEELKTAPPAPKRNKGARFRLWGGSFAAVAAAVALFFVLRTGPAPQTATDSFTDVERAFANLSTEDREYMLEVYQDELFYE